MKTYDILRKNVCDFGVERSKIKEFESLYVFEPITIFRLTCDISTPLKFKSSQRSLYFSLYLSIEFSEPLYLNEIVGKNFTYLFKCVPNEEKESFFFFNPLLHV